MIELISGDQKLLPQVLVARNGGLGQFNAGCLRFDLGLQLRQLDPYAVNLLPKALAFGLL